MNQGRGLASCPIRKSKNLTALGSIYPVSCVLSQYNSVVGSHSYR